MCWCAKGHQRNSVINAMVSPFQGYDCTAASFTGVYTPACVITAPLGLWSCGSGKDALARRLSRKKFFSL